MLEQLLKAIDVTIEDSATNKAHGYMTDALKDIIEFGESDDPLASMHYEITVKKFEAVFGIPFANVKQLLDMDSDTAFNYLKAHADKRAMDIYATMMIVAKEAYEKGQQDVLENLITELGGDVQVERAKCKPPVKELDALESFAKMLQDFEQTLARNSTSTNH